MNIDKPDAQLARQSIAERSAEPQNQVAPKPSSAPPAVNTSAEPQFSHGVQALLESSRSAGRIGCGSSPRLREFDKRLKKGPTTLTQSV